jgi:hypothetical protein
MDTARLLENMELNADTRAKPLLECIIIKRAWALQQCVSPPHLTSTNLVTTTIAEHFDEELL